MFVILFWLIAKIKENNKMSFFLHFKIIQIFFLEYQKKTKLKIKQKLKRRNEFKCK
jgi:hypothetical protein